MNKMSLEKSRWIVVFDGGDREWDGWSEQFLAKAQLKGYRKLLLCKKNLDGYDVIPTISTYDATLRKKLADCDDDKKKAIKLYELNEQAYTELILSINHKKTRGKVAFNLVKNCKSSEWPEGNCKKAWDCLVAKYAPKSTPSLLKLKKEFKNCKLEDAWTDPEDWISELEGIRTEIEAIDSASAISEKDFMVKILNNLPEEYDVILDGLENRLEASGNQKLTLEGIRDKLGSQYARIKKNKKDVKQEKAFALYMKQYKGNCTNCGK